MVIYGNSHLHCIDCGDNGRASNKATEWKLIIATDRMCSRLRKKSVYQNYTKLLIFWDRVLIELDFHFWRRHCIRSIEKMYDNHNITYTRIYLYDYYYWANCNADQYSIYLLNLYFCVHVQMASDNDRISFYLKAATLPHSQFKLVNFAVFVVLCQIIASCMLACYDFYKRLLIANIILYL